MSKIVFIDQKKEPNKYNIFTQLKEDGKAIVEKTNGENCWWRDVSKQIGRQANDLKIDGKSTILPPSSNVYHRIGYVMTNKGFVIKEEPKGKFIIDLLK